MIEINKFLNDETKWGTNHREWFKTLFCGYEIAETKEFKERGNQHERIINTK